MTPAITEWRNLVFHPKFPEIRRFDLSFGHSAFVSNYGLFFVALCIPAATDAITKTEIIIDTTTPSH